MTGIELIAQERERHEGKGYIAEYVPMKTVIVLNEAGVEEMRRGFLCGGGLL